MQRQGCFDLAGKTKQKYIALTTQYRSLSVGLHKNCRLVAVLSIGSKFNMLLFFFSMFGQSSLVSVQSVKTAGSVQTISDIFTLDSTFQHEESTKVARRKAWKSNYCFPKMPEVKTMMTSQAVLRLIAYSQPEQLLRYNNQHHCDSYPI